MLLPEPPVIELGVRVHVRPVEGEIELVSATVPVKPLTGNTRMLVVPATPGVVLIVVGLANIWKSTTWTRTVAVA